MMFGFGETKKIEEAYKKGVACEGDAYPSSRFLSKAIGTGGDETPETGGIIVLPVKSGFGEGKDFTKVRNRVHRMVKRMNQDGEQVSYELGEFFNGRFGDDGECFSNDNLCVELTNVPKKDLDEIAKTLCRVVDAGAAIVKDYATGKAVVVRTDEGVDDYAPLTEASLNHILNKDKYSEGYVIVSACRGDWDEGDRVENNRLNNEKTRELKRCAKDEGFGYIPVYGGFIENFKTDRAREVFERSLMVFPYSNRGERRGFDELKDWAKDMGIRFNQDAVLIKEPDDANGPKAPYYLVTANRDGNTIGDKQEWFGKDTYKVNDIAQQFFTSMRKKSRRHKMDDNPRRFTLTECARVCVNKDPRCHSGAHCRFSSGEFVNYNP